MQRIISKVIDLEMKFRFNFKVYLTIQTTSQFPRARNGRTDHLAGEYNNAWGRNSPPYLILTTVITSSFILSIQQRLIQSLLFSPSPSKCSIPTLQMFTSPPTSQKTTQFKPQIQDSTTISPKRTFPPPSHSNSYSFVSSELVDSLPCRVCSKHKPVQAFSKTQLLKAAPSRIHTLYLLSN
jgi:hypothetical protein